jgi:uncharacterized protein (TIGR03067 family)
MASAYAQDRAAAADKYSSKKLEVSGVIRSIQVDELGWGYALLVKDLARNSLAVKCEMYIPAGNGPSHGSREEWARLAKGRKATIAGVCDGIHTDGNVYLKQGALVRIEAGPPPLRTQWEGVWDAVSSTRAGKPDRNEIKVQWHVVDDDIVIRLESKITDQREPRYAPVKHSGTVQVNATSSPKTFLFETSWWDPAGALGGQMIRKARGVYELAGDTLRVRYTINSNVPAPQSLDDAARGEYFIELKRRTDKSPPRGP